MNSKLTINIEGMKVEGLSPLAVLKSFYALKKELEGKGCKVTISVDGQELGRADGDVLGGPFPIPGPDDENWQPIPPEQR